MYEYCIIFIISVYSILMLNFSTDIIRDIHLFFQNNIYSSIYIFNIPITYFLDRTFKIFNINSDIYRMLNKNNNSFSISMFCFVLQSILTFLLLSLYYILFKSLISKIINISKESDIFGALLVFFIIIIIKTSIIFGLKKFIDSQKDKSVSEIILNMVLFISIIVIIISVMFLFQYVLTYFLPDIIDPDIIINSKNMISKEINLSNELEIIKSTIIGIINNCGIYIIGIFMVYIILLTLTFIYDAIMNNKYEEYKNKQRLIFHSICYCLIAIYISLTIQ